MSEIQPETSPKGPRAPTRRRFLKRAAWALVGLGAGVVVYSWRIEPHWVEYVERDLAIRDLPPGLDGRTLVQFSDLRVGPAVDDDYLIEHFRRVRERTPDIVVL